MPYFKTSQEWLDLSVALLEARPSQANPRHRKILHQARQTPQSSRPQLYLRRRILLPLGPETPPRQPRPQDLRPRQRRRTQVPHHKGRRGHAPHVRRHGPPGQGAGWRAGRSRGDDAGC
ncbi:hypothetical protein N5P37_011062 [Trichoderma harzianum]|nr:hypothetical protein N5P37_011062 [Trichoderma harzianum]